nr:MAG TPA: hypothetical protein [Caudoviricetes sp.]
MSPIVFIGYFLAVIPLPCHLAKHKKSKTVLVTV